MSFHTIKPFEYVRHRTFTYRRAGSIEPEATTVMLTFSHSVAKQDWNEALDVTLPVDDLNEHVRHWGSGVRLERLPAEFESTY